MMILPTFLLLASFLRWINAQGVPPAWAGWPECAFTCADGLGCKFPEDRCVCVHNTFLACVTFSLCGSDDADITREKWDALCTYEPPGLPSTSESSSALSTSAPSTSTKSTPSTTSNRTVISTITSTSTPTSSPASTRQSVSDTSVQPTQTSVSLAPGRSSSTPPPLTRGINTQTSSPAPVATTSSSNDAVLGTPPVDRNSVEPERKRNTGATVGGVLGGLAGLGLLFALLCYRKRQETKKAGNRTAQPMIEGYHYPDEKGRPVGDNAAGYSATHPPERVNAYEKSPIGNEHGQPNTLLDHGSFPVNQISPFDASPTNNDGAFASVTSKARVVGQTPPSNVITVVNNGAQESATAKGRVIRGPDSESPTISPFDLKPVVHDGDDDIYAGIVNESGPSREVQPQAVYIPRSSVEKVPDPFGDPPTESGGQGVTPASGSQSAASLSVVEHEMDSRTMDPISAVAHAVDSAAVDVAPGPLGPAMVYAMDSEVQPPPYIRP
ncbi:hypothetical protein BJ165DRAFT_575567 [Panaeolus papilionaceus]|nr:hypothetical protein BJ165DRAFT_575567 [Panaeolus papilionaceus]